MKTGYTLRKGSTRVLIFSVDKRKKIGEGLYIGTKKWSGWDMPRFRVGRRVIWGYECWWIPVKVARDIEKKCPELKL